MVRYLALAALAVWLGGMAVLGLVVAPAVFRAAPAAGPTGGVLAGAALTEILHLFHLLVYACGAVLLVCLFVIKFVGPPPRAFKLRAALVAIMLAIAVYSGVPLARQIRETQSHAAGRVGALPGTDPQLARMDGLHRTGMALMAVNMTLGMVLLAWYVRE